MKRKVGIALAGLLIGALAVLAGGRLPFFMWYVYALALLIPLGHSLLGKRFLRGEIILLEGEITAGEAVPIRYRIENPMPISFPRLELTSDIGYRLTGRREPPLAFSLQAKDSMEEESVLVCRRRGIYELGELRLTIRDILDLAGFEKRISTPIALKVFPRVIPISTFRIIASQQMGHLKVKDPLFQDYAELSDLRRYREGDPVRRIHWKASARRDNLMVKEFEERGDTEVFLLLDSCREHYRGDPENWVADQLVDAAASVVDYCLKRNIMVTLQYDRPGSCQRFQGDTPAYLKHFLEGLARFQATETQPYAHQISAGTSRLAPGTALLLLTPMLDRKLAAQVLQLKMSYLHPNLLVFGDAVNMPVPWNQNREIGKKLFLEGIPFYLFDRRDSIRDVLEGSRDG